MSGIWTPQKTSLFREQYEEFRHHIKINSKDLGGGAVLADHTFLSQKMLLDGVFDALSNDIHDIKVLKSRQLGVSTETRALSLFWIGMHPGLKGAMVYDSDPNKESARQDLIYTINELPKRLKFPRVKSDNRYGLTLENDSVVAFKAAGTRSNRSGGGLGRSIGINFAHCSEMCSWENTEGVISFQQSLSEIFPDRLYVFESTARGPGLWQDMWDDAVKDTSNQKTIFLGWWSKDSQKFDKNSKAFHQYGLAPPTPDEQKRIDAVEKLYGVKVTQEQLAWYRRKMDPAGEADDESREQREGDDYKNAEQPWTEHEAFIASGSTFFPAERITEIRGQTTSNRYKPFRYYPGDSFVTCLVQPARNWKETQLKVWEDPVDDAVYVIAIDPAFGHDENNDRSSIQILRAYADCIEQVAEFSDPLTPTNHLAWIVWSLVGWYGAGHTGNASNPVHTIFELNGPGDAVWLEFKSVPNIVKNGYLRVEAKEKGIENIFNNVRNYVYTRSDSMGVGSAYHFKCLELDTPLPTPTGWVTIGDVSPGDSLFDEKGRVCKVLKAHPVNHNHECYRVWFSDNTCVVADADHLWLAGRSVKNKSLWTEALCKTSDLIPGTHSITLTEPLILPDISLPIDPYILGVWLGDGYSSGGTICAGAKDIAHIRAHLAERGATFGVTARDSRSGVWRQAIHGLSKQLSENKLIKNKHIPKKYLRGSFEQRLALFQGLMDTDGSIDTNRQCSFHTTSEKLAEGFSELLRTLGIRARFLTKTPTLNYKGRSVVCNKAWQFWFTAPSTFPAFKLRRKLDRQDFETDRADSRARRLFVTSVDRADSVPVRCIEVDSPSHLFLAGEAMVPTHNTTNPTKVSIMERLRGYVIDGSMLIHSAEALDEMRNVTRNGDIIKAEGRRKDDRVITLALGCRCWDDRARKALIAANRTKKADQAKRAASIRDQYSLYSSNLLQDFFAAKKRARIRDAAELRRRAWRGR